MNGLYVDTLKHGNWVEFICTGTLTLEEAIGLGIQIREEMLKDPATDHVLVDVTRARVQMNMMQRFQLGEYIAHCQTAGLQGWL